MSNRPGSIGAVFLSYASEDADAATRICEGLREAGIEVWFDREELRGGDTWDAQIRKQIHDCALVVPLISAHSNARAEGYFRREWKLATRRLLDMADDVAFLVPIVVDDTRESGARVPEEFLGVQWTWLPEGRTTPAFVQRVRKLLGVDDAGERGAPAVRAEASPAGIPLPSTAPSMRRVPGRRGGKRAWALAVSAAILAGLSAAGYRYYTGEGATSAAEAADSFAPPPRSVAVLPFENMSGDPADDHFAEGLTEEVLNTLGLINDLQVAARTSSFSFEGSAVDIPTVGRKLNVGAVLQGSVRKVQERVRVTAQLIDTVTGFHLWSETFDRDLKDAFDIQSEIATRVAIQLQLVLVAGERRQATEGGTKDPAAFDAYLRAQKLYGKLDQASLRAAIGLFDRAVELDPNYALAHAFRADAIATLAEEQWGSHAEVPDALLAQAKASAEKAVALMPKFGTAYSILAHVLTASGAGMVAVESVLKRGLAADPQNSNLLSDYATLAASLQRPDAISAARQAVALSPLNSYAVATLYYVLFLARDYDEARIVLKTYLTIADTTSNRAARGVLEIASGRPADALPHCEPEKSESMGRFCLAIAYHQLGRKPEATANFNELLADEGDAWAYQYAQIQAQWGQRDKAIEWLETAVRLRDPSLNDIRVDPFVDPLQGYPEFKTIVDQLESPT